MPDFKYLHIMQNDKFIAPFIGFIDKNLSPDEHLFIILGGLSESDHPVPKQKSVVILDEALIKKRNILKLSTVLNPYFLKAEKIMLHSLLIPNIIDFLFLYQRFLKKSNWVIWGWDLYKFQQEKKTFLQKFAEYRKKTVIKELGELTTFVKGDYELARQWYGAKGDYNECLMYPSNLYNSLDVSSKKETSTIVIQIGNSASRTNNHLGVLEKLKKYAHEDIKIICPLSYGDKKNAQAVISRGKQLFGEKFEPLVDFMPFEEYLQLLGKIDIAVFNFDRQQGMGNITTLLGLGKKVYIRKNITPWQTYRDKNIILYDINDLSLEPMDETVKMENIENVKNYFSEKTLKTQLNNIFSKDNHV